VGDPERRQEKQTKRVATHSKHRAHDERRSNRRAVARRHNLARRADGYGPV